MHVAVVGLMGAGKTTVGRLVADELGVPFIDNDEALQARAGATAAEVADELGIDELHRLEAEVLCELLAEADPAVIAAAASTIEVPDTRAALDSHAFVAWLQAPVGVLAVRARTGSHRPLHLDVEAQLAAQAERRQRLFESVADLVVDVTSTAPADAAAAIVDGARAAGFTLV